MRVLFTFQRTAMLLVSAEQTILRVPIPLLYKGEEELFECTLPHHLYKSGAMWGVLKKNLESSQPMHAPPPGQEDEFKKVLECPTSPHFSSPPKNEGQPALSFLVKHT